MTGDVIDRTLVRHTLAGALLSLFGKRLIISTTAAAIGPR